MVDLIYFINVPQESNLLDTCALSCILIGFIVVRLEFSVLYSHYRRRLEQGPASGTCLSDILQN